MRIENALGMGIIEVAQNMGNGSSKISEIAVILEQGLRGGGNDLKMRDIQNIMREAGIIESMRAASEIIASGLGSDAVEDDDEGND